jgi:uncharacterized protein (TIRG00374 family)
MATKREGLSVMRFIPILVGIAALGALIAAVAGWGDQEKFVAIARDSQPAWVLLAVVLQAATYATEACAWGVVLVRAGKPQPAGRLYALALVALVTNQALPVAGLAGTMVVLDALERHGVKKAVALAAVMVDEVGYLASYGIWLGIAVAVLTFHHQLSPVVLALAVVAIAIGAALTGGVMWLATSGRSVPRWVSRWKRLDAMVQPLLSAEPTLVHDPVLLLAATALRFGNFALDALTLWACLRAVGVHVPALQVAAAFALASLARSLGIIPGGLGTFEASAVGGLLLFGVRTEPGLAATLLFRGLSFWLPMGPGLWLGYRIRARRR